MNYIYLLKIVKYFQILINYFLVFLGNDLSIPENTLFIF